MSIVLHTRTKLLLSMSHVIAPVFIYSVLYYNGPDDPLKIDPLSEEGAKPGRTKGAVEFKNIFFAYPTRPDMQVQFIQYIIWYITSALSSIKSDVLDPGGRQPCKACKAPSKAIGKISTPYS